MVGYRTIHYLLLHRFPLACVVSRNLRRWRIFDGRHSTATAVNKAEENQLMLFLHPTSFARERELPWC